MSIGDLCTFLLTTGLWTFLVLISTHASVRFFPQLDDALRVSLAWVMVATLGLLAFGFWYLGPKWGMTYDLAVCIGVAVQFWRGRREFFRWFAGAVETRTQVALLVAIAFCYWGYLFLAAPSTGTSVESLAANRFVAGLPIDNQLPRLFAEKLIAGTHPRVLHGDWLSSDRPPLQTSLLLLLHPFVLCFGGDFRTAAQVLGMMLQLWWVPATWSLFRVFGLSRDATPILVAALACTATPLIHTLFVWPKLAAAGASVTAAVIYFGTAQRSSMHVAVAASCAALAWLAHASAAFPLLILFAAALFRRPYPSRRSLLVSTALIAILCLPWLAYQRVEVPPGNRLLKWHLAGVSALDPRSFPETIGTAYHDLSAQALWDHKSTNLRYPFFYGLSNWLRWPRPTDAAERYQVFYFLIASLGPWNLVWPLVLWRALRGSRALSAAKPPEPSATPLRVTLGLTLATAVLWALLLFGPAATMIHQGSLAVPLALLAILLATAWQCHRVLFAILALWQLTIFLVVWLPPTQPRPPGMPPGNLFATVWFGLGLAGLGMIALRHWHASARPAT